MKRRLEEEEEERKKERKKKPTENYSHQTSNACNVNAI